MITLNCTSCGAEVSFRSKASVFAVCSFCKSTLVRRDMNLEVIGKMSYLLDDLTPIQLGTTGKFGKERFEVIGRMKVGYKDGFWNEWYCLFPGEKEGWLAEAQGFYGVCFPHDEVHPPVSNKIRPGTFIDFGRAGAFEVEDVRNVRCVLSEGELPMSAAQGRSSLSVDLTAPVARMATLEYAGDELRAFVGDYQDFDEFEFKNLRRIHGWKL